MIPIRNITAFAAAGIILQFLPRAVVAETPAPAGIQRFVAVDNVCAWPQLTLLRDGTIAAILHNQPAHGQREGDVECWVSESGEFWRKAGTPTQHEPNAIRMNHAAGLAKNGDLLVLCSGWTNEKQPQRPKQAAFRDDILRSWVCRSSDGGRTWSVLKEFPAALPGWTEFIRSDHRRRGRRASHFLLRRRVDGPGQDDEDEELSRLAFPQ
jgi:hypothetical protein